MNLIKSLFKNKTDLTPVPKTLAKTQTNDSSFDDAYPIKFYKLTEDFVFKKNFMYSFDKIDAGRIFAKWSSPFNGSQKTWLMATSTLPKYRIFDSLIKTIQNSIVLEEIFMTDIKKNKPHWHKEFKETMEIYKKKESI